MRLDITDSIYLLRHAGFSKIPAEALAKYLYDTEKETGLELFMSPSHLFKEWKVLEKVEIYDMFPRDENGKSWECSKDMMDYASRMYNIIPLKNGKYLVELN